MNGRRSALLPRGSSVAACGLFLLTVAVGVTAEPVQRTAQVEAAIQRGRVRLLALAQDANPSEVSLIAYALVKSGLPKETPRIQQSTARTAAKIRSGIYGAGTDPAQHIYEAACDAMLLVEMDAKQYQPEIAVLRDYFVRKQLPNGSWYYPSVPQADAGDTSITQFALLGLWAVRRANVEVPPKTFEQAARWLIDTQNPDGGFCYHRFEAQAPQHRETTHSMTAAGMGALLIARRMLYPQGGLDTEVAVSQYRKRYGVLENLTPEAVKPAAPQPSGPTLSAETIDKAIRGGRRWIADHYETRVDQRWYFYYQYACERVGALLDTETFGTHRWYDEGAQSLIKCQRPEGDWQLQTPIPDPTGLPTRSTSFALLFLSRSTQSIVTPTVRARMVGGGLLVGGRGLPENLNALELQDGQAKARKLKGPVDSLLADLEQPQNPQLEEAREALLDAIQLDRREELLGQTDRLLRLLRDPRAEVREVAAWALGRGDNLRVAPRLIEALDDPDPNVAWEASLSLCLLSRQPQGVPRAGKPKEVVPPDPPNPDDEGGAALRRWRADARRSWNQWYLQIRPYDERDDRQQLRKK